ncbi:MAG: PaaI family thioesterase [Arenimonas sp.]
MQAEPVEYVDGERLVMRFPVLERYQNPFGYMQGGFVLAALDNTLGPFSFLIAPPSVTQQVTINQVRPVTPDQGHITCVATVLERTRRTLYLTGRALGDDGRLFAIAQATCQIV